MGEAKAEKARKAREVVFDFAAPAHRILLADKFILSREPDGTDARTKDGSIDLGRVRSRATCQAITFVVAAAYPQATGWMRPKDSDDYDVWLEAMDEIDGNPAEGLARYQIIVTVGDLEWMLRHLKNDGLGVPPGMVQWRRKTLEYVEALLVEPKREGSDAEPAEEAPPAVGA